MRFTRPLLLLAIAVIVAATGATYYFARLREQAKTPPKPHPLPEHLSAAAADWSWSHTVEGRPVVEVRARNFRQVKEPSSFELLQVELRVFDKDGARFDQVRSAKAQFDIARGVLYSEGDVQITMGVPAGQAPLGRLVFIRTSGATFESRTGKAYTGRPAFFTFDQGEGKSIGAAYDPAFRELHMKSQAEVTWRGQGSRATPMKVEAGELMYKERDSAVLLWPWSRLTRDSLVLEGGKSIVWLDNGALCRVETENARGLDKLPDRQVEYAASRLYLHFTPAGAIEKIEAVQNARLVSADQTTRTTVTGNRLELEFDAPADESLLKKARVIGRGVVEGKPQPSARLSPETRVLRSESIELIMRAGGREVDTVLTHAPGSVEFLPNRPGQRRRSMDGERLVFTYGPENRIRSFRASKVSTRTEGAAPSGKPEPAPVLTWSRELHADFDPKSGDVLLMVQSGDFRYEEASRRGRAGRAVFDAPHNRITLEGAARLWDPAGSVDADQIVLDQATGDVLAHGKVSSTREPDSRKSDSGLLSAGQPLQAKADHMLALDSNNLLRYEGSAVLWQGANRIRGDWIEIDRKARRLVARGNVKSQFVEDVAPAAAEGTERNYTVIDAPEMVYTDADGTARYRGGVTMLRGGMTVKARELNAVLAAGDAGSRLEKLLADGGVEIVEHSAGRVRKGTAEHAEYYAGDQRVVLTGGEPVFTDGARGATRGRQLTWFAGEDRLLVEGAEARPAVTRIQRK